MLDEFHQETFFRELEEAYAWHRWARNFQAGEQMTLGASIAKTMHAPVVVTLASRHIVSAGGALIREFFKTVQKHEEQ